jgi:16S rRNA (uracil1498-N3)-methyltransferase
VDTGERDGPERPARYRFYLPAAAAGAEIPLERELLHRLGRVLRLGAGDQVSVFDGSGRAWLGEIARLSAREGAVRLLAEEPPALPEPPAVLLQALIRPQRFEWLLEKATELGVTALTPLVAARSAVRPAEIGPSRLERWRRIVVEAAEQSGRRAVPVLHTATDLPGALAAGSGVCFLLTEPAHGARETLGSALAALPAGEPVTLLCGPEGGWTAAEVTAAAAHGARSVMLAATILRAETAALAALAIIADRRAAGDGAAGMRAGTS